MMYKKVVLICFIFITFISLAGCSYNYNIFSFGYHKSQTDQGKVFYEYADWVKPPLYQGNAFANNGVGLQVFGAAYEGLFDYVSLNGTYYLRLAKSYENKGNQTVIHLQTDVKWSDGTKFTSRDIWAYYMLNNNTATSKYLSGIETPDDSTVIFDWANPQLNSKLKMQYLASDVQGTVQYEYYKQYVDKAAELLNSAKKSTGISDNSFLGRQIDTNTKTALEENYNKFVKSGPDLPLGTGPFKINKITYSNIIMDRNPYYWNKKNIKYDYIYLYQANEISAMGPQYALKMADRLEGIQQRDILNNALKANKNIIHYITYSNTTTGLIFNISNPPFNDINFRRALVYIINRDKIRDIGNSYALTDKYSTLGMPYTYAKDMVLPGIFDKMTKYNYDTKKASQLLENIGWTKGSDGIWKDQKGKTYNFTIPSLNPVEGQIAADYLSKFGLKTSMKDMTDPNAVNEFYTYTKQKNIDMASGGILENALGIYDPVNILKQFYEGYPCDAGHFPKTDGVPDLKLPGYDGKTVDIAETLNKIPFMNDDDMKKAVSNLVWITNENAFGVTYYQNVAGFWINTKTVKGYPYADLVKKYKRNVPVQLNNNGKNINEYQLLWQSQARLLVNGSISPK